MVLVSLKHVLVFAVYFCVVFENRTFMHARRTYEGHTFPFIDLVLFCCVIS